MDAFSEIQDYMNMNSTDISCKNRETRNSKRRSLSRFHGRKPSGPTEWGLGDFCPFSESRSSNICPIIKFLSGIKEQWNGIEVSDIVIDSKNDVSSVSETGQVGSIPALTDLNPLNKPQEAGASSIPNTTHTTHTTHTRTHMISGTY